MRRITHSRWLDIPCCRPSASIDGLVWNVQPLTHINDSTPFRMSLSDFTRFACGSYRTCSASHLCSSAHSCSRSPASRTRSSGYSALHCLCVVRRKGRGTTRRTKLGETVKSLRERREFSQSQLAKRARLTQPYLAQIERGVRKNPSLKTLRSIARALGVPVDSLIR